MSSEIFKPKIVGPDQENQDIVFSSKMREEIVKLFLRTAHLPGDVPRDADEFEDKVSRIENMIRGKTTIKK